MLLLLLLFFLHGWVYQCIFKSCNNFACKFTEYLRRMKMFLIQIRIGQVLLNQNVRSFTFIERQSILPKLLPAREDILKTLIFHFEPTNNF